jgi:hypothetical protein
MLALLLAKKALYVHAIKILRMPALLLTHATCGCTMADSLKCMGECVQKDQGCASEQTQATFCGFCCLTCHCPCGLDSSSGNFGGDERGDFLYRHLMDLPMSGIPGLCPAWWNGVLKRMMIASHLAATQICDPSFRLKVGVRGSPEAERAWAGVSGAVLAQPSQVETLSAAQIDEAMGDAGLADSIRMLLGGSDTPLRDPLGGIVSVDALAGKVHPSQRATHTERHEGEIWPKLSDFRLGCP